MNSSKHINTFFSLSLLLVFVICSFMCLMMQINGYQQVNADNLYQQQVHTPYAYISNKIKMADGISVENNRLILKNEGMNTIIYYQDGYLKEMSVVEGVDVVDDMGEELFSLDDVSMSVKDNVFVFLYRVDDTQKEYTFKLRKGELE